MKSQHTEHKTFFEKAYKTGTDVWTHNSHTEQILDCARMLPHKSTVLDLGSGWGHYAYLLADLGHKVIGLDFVEELTERNNQEVKEKGYAGKVAFMTGDVFDIPLQDQSFDAVSDFGTLQHSDPNHWEEYKKEIVRVLKPRGFLLLAELSRHTDQFLNIRPRESETGNFDIYGLHYHFFTKKELIGIFEQDFTLIKSTIVNFKEINNQSYIFALFQKK